MKPISKRPNEIIEIRNDNEANAFLLQCGILNKFSKRAPLAEEWAETVTYADHPTHWVLATLFNGFPNASDNGFHVQCFPKTQFDEAEMDGLLAEFNRQMFPGGAVGKLSPIEPPKS